MRFLKGRFQKLRSDHLVVGAQGSRWTREGGYNSTTTTKKQTQLYNNCKKKAHQSKKEQDYLLSGTWEIGISLKSKQQEREDFNDGEKNSGKQESFKFSVPGREKFRG